MASQIERFTFKSFGGNDSFTPLPANDLSPMAQAPEAAPPPPEPTMSMAEVEQVRKEAYNNGFREAQKEAEAKAQSELSRQNQTIATLEAAISSQLQEASKTQTSLLESKRHEITRISLAIAKKVAGAALRQEPVAAIEELVGQCLTSLVGENKITITVHPSVHLALQKRLAPLLESSGFDGEAAVLADDSLPKEDCKIEWKHGSALRDSAEIWTEIESLIAASKPTLSGKSDAEPDEDNTIYLANR